MKRVLLSAFLLAFAFTWQASLPARAAGEEGAPAAEGGKDAPKDAKKDAAKGEEDGKSKKPADISGGRFAGDPVYVHITPITLPVISSTGVEQLVTIALAVEITDFDVADDIHSNMPRVQDALLRALYGGLGNGNLRNGKLVDIDKVKAKTTAALNEVLGPGKIHDVLVEGVSQRML
jgi:flagellar basal body-associated protein FliL